MKANIRFLFDEKTKKNNQKGKKQYNRPSNFFDSCFNNSSSSFAGVSNSF